LPFKQLGNRFESVKKFAFGEGLDAGQQKLSHARRYKQAAQPSLRGENRLLGEQNRRNPGFIAVNGYA